MKKWLQSAAPALLVAVLIAAVALGGGPGVNPLNRVNRDGDTMQGVLRVTQKGTGLVTLSADPTVAAGEGAGSGLFMKTGAPNIFMINTGLSGTTQRAYQILINVSRVLEVSSLADDGSNPQTLCQFDYYTGGATPEFSCVTIIGTKQFASSQVSGSNGFVCNTNGCRIDYGSGANDYASSDGTTVTFAGPVTETGAFNATGAAGDITLGGGDLTSSLATQTFNIISATNGTTATASIGTITLSPSATLGANDLVLNVQSVTGGTNLFTVDLEGDAVLVATMTAGNFIATGTTIPANGMYLPSASTVGFAANGVIEATLSATNFNPGANTGNSLGGAGIEWLQSNIRNMVVSSNGGLINEGATTVLTAAAAITTLINSDITAANASTTNAAFQLTTGRALDANDLLFSIATSVPTRVFTVDNEGDVVANTIALTSPLVLTSGGTNASLTASNGAFVYSTATALALTGVGTSGDYVISQGAASPTYVRAPIGTFGGYCPATGAAACESDVLPTFLGGFKTSRTGGVTATTVTCSWGTAGTVGSTGVVARIQQNDGTELCSCTIGACTIAANTPTSCVCSGAMAVNTVYGISLKTTTDCTLNPLTVFCNATYSNQ